MPIHHGLPSFRAALQAVGVVASMWACPQVTAGQATWIPRVRANDDPFIASLIREATERSGTFRRLVETIDATDGIVYVQKGRCGHNVLTCLALTVRVAGPSRILRIVQDTRRNHDALIAAIGHELQHAVEALGDPHVTDATIYSFFDRIGRTSKDRFETDAAIQAELEIAAELHQKTRESRPNGSRGRPRQSKSTPIRLCQILSKRPETVDSANV